MADAWRSRAVFGTVQLNEYADDTVLPAGGGIDGDIGIITDWDSSGDRTLAILTSGAWVRLGGATFPDQYTTAALPASGPEGLVAYDTTLNKLTVYTGAAWEAVTST